MGRVESLSHSRWECKYHVVITPKYRKKVFFGRTRRKIGEIIRELSTLSADSAGDKDYRERSRDAA